MCDFVNKCFGRNLKMVPKEFISTFYSYLDLCYDTFDMPTIIGYDVAQTNRQIQHHTLKCRNINIVDDLLKGCFQLSNGFWRNFCIHFL